jgi:hypothetical protein
MIDEEIDERTRKVDYYGASKIKYGAPKALRTFVHFLAVEQGAP